MKNIRILFLMTAVMCMLSCDNAVEVVVPTFEVRTEKKEYKVNDTVHFMFSGDAEYITFYAGDKGAEYKHRFRTQISNATPILTFTSEGKFGLPERNLSLHIATDFNGTINTDNILKADWQDISERVTFSTGTIVPSGEIDLSDFVEFPQVHLAFKYVGIGNTAQPQKTWFIRDFVLQTYDEENNTYPIVNGLSQGGWLQHSVEGPTRVWRISANDLYLGANANEAANEDWVITKALNLAAINPDNGVPIKNLTGTIEPLYHVYTVPGEYIVTFVAKNQSVYGEHEVVREVHLTIEE